MKLDLCAYCFHIVNSRIFTMFIQELPSPTCYISDLIDESRCNGKLKAMVVSLRSRLCRHSRRVLRKFCKAHLTKRTSQEVRGASIHACILPSSLRLFPYHRAKITTWDLTECGIGDSGLTSLLPAWWRIFCFITPVRELRLAGNGLSAGGLAPFFDMMNGKFLSFLPYSGSQALLLLP